MKLAVGLPDLHPGKGTPIGAAFISVGAVYPALVGSDIGCGIGLWRTKLNGRKPKREAWADKLRGLDDAWDGDADQWLAARGIAASGFEHCLGTIGSGNHFAELQAIESVANPAVCEEHGLTEDAAYLCVHSGSRGFGESVLREHIEDNTGYLARHDRAVQWARANRELIAARIFDCLKTEGTRLLDVCHNSVEQIDFDGTPGWLHRKGAAPSTSGIVVIPGSRGALSYVVRPVDPRVDSAYSLAHGAGRKWSRSDSRARLENRYSPKDLARTELGSHVICEDKALLYEEAPQAYKNITTVIADLVDAGLAEVIAVLKPIITYKVRR